MAIAAKNKIGIAVEVAAPLAETGDLSLPGGRAEAEALVAAGKVKQGQFLLLHVLALSGLFTPLWNIINQGRQSQSWK